MSAMPPEPPMSNDVVQLVAGSQYFAVAGVVILIYNHILSFEDEVEYIWRAKSTAPKLLFLILRYIVPSSIIWHTHQLTGISHTLSPDRWFISVVCLCVITTGPLHFFVMLRLWVISERNKRLVFGTLAFFLITEIAIVACGIAVGIELRPVVTRVVLSNNNNQTWCVLSERRIFWIMSLPGMLFEAVALFAMCFNVTKITASGKGKIYNLPSQHGIECVVTVFFLNAVKLIGSILIPVSVMFLYVTFLWSASTVAMTRMIIDLRKRSICTNSVCGEDSDAQHEPHLEENDADSV